MLFPCKGVVTTGLRKAVGVCERPAERTGKVLTDRAGTVFGEVLRRHVSGNRSNMAGDEAESSWRPLCPPSMEGKMKQGKSQGLHCVLGASPSFNTNIAYKPIPRFPISAGHGGQGRPHPLKLALPA